MASPALSAAEPLKLLLVPENEVVLALLDPGLPPREVRLHLTLTPGGALWATVFEGVLYYRLDPGTVITAMDHDRWAALVGEPSE